MKFRSLYISFQLWPQSMKQVLACFAILVLGSLNTQIVAQQSVSSSQILGRQQVIDGNDLLNQNLDFLKEGKQKMPLINEIEVRTETDELDLSRQEYLMRFNFNQRQARKVQNEITQNNIRYYELKSQIEEEAALIDRYELIIDWYYAENELAHLEKMKILLEDEKTVYRNALSSSLKLDLDDLLKVEKEIQELERDVLKLDLRREYIIRQLFSEQTNSTNFRLDSSKWISLETMAKVLAEAKALPTYNLAQAIQDVRIDFEQLSFNKEKAENNQVLDFVQLKYSGRESLVIQQELSLGIGFRIPTKASGRVKLNEAQLDIFDEKYKRELQRANLSEKIAGYYTAFEGIIKEYELLQKQIESSQLSETLKSYSKTGAVNPLILLQLNEAIQKDQQSLRELEKDACDLYLEILADKGLLSQIPLINYLSDDLEQF